MIRVHRCAVLGAATGVCMRSAVQQCNAGASSSFGSHLHRADLDPSHGHAAAVGAMVLLQLLLARIVCVCYVCSVCSVCSVCCGLRISATSSGSRQAPCCDSNCSNSQRELWAAWHDCCGHLRVSVGNTSVGDGSHDKCICYAQPLQYPKPECRRTRGISAPAAAPPPLWRLPPWPSSRLVFATVMWGANGLPSS